MEASNIGRNLLLGCFFLAGLAHAQAPVTISGKASDTKGASIPAAAVRLLAGNQTKAETLTNEDGIFALPNLPPGVYKLIIDMPGFQKFEKDTTDTAMDASRNLAIILQPTPPPPRPPKIAVPGALANMTQAAQPTGNTPDFRTVQTTDLPGMRLFQEETVQGGTETISAAARQNNLLLINGNSTSLDAGNLGDPAFLQQITDQARMMGFQLGTFADPMAQGGSGGRGGEAGGMGGAIGILGGPGGGPGGGGMPGGFIMMGPGGRGAIFKQPKIQGSVSETFSNSALNARAYSLTGQDLDKPVSINNNYNITLGGVIPFIKAKTASNAGGGGAGGAGAPGGPGGGMPGGFLMGGPGGPGGGRPGWTFTYSGTRNRTAQNVLTTVPTDLERSGDSYPLQGAEFLAMRLQIQPAGFDALNRIHGIQYFEDTDGSRRAGKDKASIQTALRADQAGPAERLHDF
jgi:hypothetical protein